MPSTSAPKWRAIYRLAFHRGGQVLTSALTGIEHALWGTEKLADKLGHDWRNAETYDPRDGSVVDW